MRVLSLVLIMSLNANAQFENCHWAYRRTISLNCDPAEFKVAGSEDTCKLNGKLVCTGFVVCEESNGPTMHSVACSSAKASCNEISIGDCANDNSMTVNDSSGEAILPGRGPVRVIK